MKHVKLLLVGLQGGNLTVPANTPHDARGGWAGNTRGLVEDFLAAETTTLTVDGGQPVDKARAPERPV